MEYLIAVDLEGVGGAVGKPNETLNKTPDYAVAIENATKEINAAVAALFDNGATRVVVWDNHGSGKNLDFSKIDARAERAEATAFPYRMDFAKEYAFSGILYIGYHAMEGTFGGVLAHTFSSVAIQYVKINGRLVGELEIDSYIAATHNMPPLFLVGDDICVGQFLKSSPHTVSVITKYGKGRNKADLRDEEAILGEIYAGVAKCVGASVPVMPLACPAEVEVRYTRAEAAEDFYNKALLDKGVAEARYGEDTHTVFYTVREPNRIPYLL